MISNKYHFLLISPKLKSQITVTDNEHILRLENDFGGYLLSQDRLRTKNCL